MGVTDGVDDPAQDGWAALGRPVPAKVWIVVLFEVAAGTSQAPCEVPGHGWVTAAHARQIITAPGSVWQHLPVDVDTGQALGLVSAGYTPSPRLAGFVRARDVRRGPAAPCWRTGATWTTSSVACGLPRRATCTPRAGAATTPRPPGFGPARPVPTAG